jgi:hypothetical protein
LDAFDGQNSGAEHSVCVLLLLDEPLHLFMLLLGVKTSRLDSCLTTHPEWIDFDPIKALQNPSGSRVVRCFVPPQTLQAQLPEFSPGHLYNRNVFDPKSSSH